MWTEFTMMTPWGRLNTLQQTQTQVWLTLRDTWCTRWGQTRGDAKGKDRDWDTQWPRQGGGSAPLLLPPIWQGSRTAHLSYSTIWWMLNTSRQSPGIWSMYLIKLRLLNMLHNSLRQLVPTPIMNSRTKLHIVWKWKSLPSTLLLLECSSPAKWKETGILLLPLIAFHCCPPRLVVLSLTFTGLSYSQGNWRALGRTCEKQHLEDWVTAHRQRAQFGLSTPEKPYFHSCHSSIFPFNHLHQPPSLLYPSQNSTSKCAYTCPAWMPSAWVITLSEQKR